jgi:hypothetical protein
MYPLSRDGCLVMGQKAEQNFTTASVAQGVENLGILVQLAGKKHPGLPPGHWQESEILISGNLLLVIFLHVVFLFLLGRLLAGLLIGLICLFGVSLLVRRILREGHSRQREGQSNRK